MAIGCRTESAEFAAKRPASAQQSATVCRVPATEGNGDHWAKEGDRLRKFKRKILAEHCDPPANSVDFAYRSAPVDVEKLGGYVLIFGPLGAEFDWPRSPSGVAFNFPPDAKFAYQLGALRIVKKGGEPFVEQEIVVTKLQQPYRKLTVWMY